MKSSRRELLKILATLPMAGIPSIQLPKGAKSPAPIKPREYSFENFVVGQNNETAYAACMVLARAPGDKELNPFFLCGPVGMGKTHLLAATALEMSKNFPKMRIKYMNTDMLIDRTITAIRKNQIKELRQRFLTDTDALFLEDVHMLRRGEALQEEFLQLIDHYEQNNKALIVTSDSTPASTELWPKIQDRFMGGFVAEIKMPGDDVSRAVLRYKSTCYGMRVPDDVIEYITRTSPRSFREMDGHLVRLKLASELRDRPITLDLAMDVIPTDKGGV